MGLGDTMTPPTSAAAAVKRPLRRGQTDRMAAGTDVASELDGLWRAIPALLEQEDGWALREVLACGVAGYTREADTPKGLLIRHNPDGSRQLVRIDPNGPDTVIRPL